MQLLFRSKLGISNNDKDTLLYFCGIFDCIPKLIIVYFLNVKFNIIIKSDMSRSNTKMKLFLFNLPFIVVAIHLIAGTACLIDLAMYAP